MNSTLYDPAGTELDIRCVTADTPVPEDLYATTPMGAVRPAYRQPDEEELHTSFEEAISDRVLAVNRQLQRMSGAQISAQCVQPQMGVPAGIRMQGWSVRPWLSEGALRRGVLCAGIALMLVLVGFDLMGLLVLHVR